MIYVRTEKTSISHAPMVALSILFATPPHPKSEPPRVGAARLTHDHDSISSDALGQIMYFKTLGTISLVTIAHLASMGCSSPGDTTVIPTPETDAGHDAGHETSPAALASDVNSLFFPELKTGETREPAVITVRNDGNAPTSPLRVWSLYSGFHITQDDCDGRVLAAHATCALTVELQPAYDAAYRGRIEVTAQSGGKASFDILGVDAPGAVTTGGLTADVQAVFFPELKQGEAREPAVVTLRNDSDKTMSALHIEAKPFGDTLGFRIVKNDCDGTALAPHAMCRVTVEAIANFGSCDRGQLIATHSKGSLQLDVVAIDAPSASPTRGITSDVGKTVYFTNARRGETRVPIVVRFRNEGDVPTGPIHVVPTDNGHGFQLTNNDCEGRVLATYETCAITVAANQNVSLGYRGHIDVSGQPGGTISLDVIAMTERN
jgi:hypothetical protein